MQERQNGPNIKYFSSLSYLLKPYRWMGIIRFDDYGKIDKKLVLYSIFTVMYQVTFLCVGSYRHIKNYKFYSLDKVSRIPFIMEWISHSTHFLVSTTVFLRNSQFLIRMFSSTEGVRRKLSDGDQELINGALKIRLLSVLTLLLSIAASGLYVTEIPGLGTKFILILGYLLNFSTYVKEETLLMYVMYLKVMLQVMNKKLRTSVVTAESVRKFRSIHNELSLLTESVSEQFEPLVTTMVAACGLQTWGNCFTLIRIAASESPNLYLAACFVCNVMNNFFKLLFICYNCEIVEQQELKMKINVHDLGNDISLPEEFGYQIRCFSLQMALEKMEIRGYGFALNNALLFSVYSTIFSFLLVLLQIHL